MTAFGQIQLSILACATFISAFGHFHSAQAQEIAVSAGGGRKLAPDAIVVIPPGADYGDTFQGPIDLETAKADGAAWTPSEFPVSDTLAEMSKNVTFHNDAYSLEFAFKPARMVKVGNETVWYLLYRLRYLGGDYHPKVEDAPFAGEVFAQPQSVNAQWVRCMPTFSLDVKKTNKSYLDQIYPAARDVIAAKERVGSPIYTSTEIQRLKIKLTTEAESNPVWGVATWRGIDPTTDFFSIEITGLTNAQRLKQEGDSIQYLQKRLVLHFTRPGDSMDELEDRIRYGIPALTDPVRQKYVLDQFGVQERLDYNWVYR